MIIVMEVIQSSVRPLVTLAVTFALVWGWMHERLSDDAFLGVAGMVIGFWFQMRQDAAHTEHEIRQDQAVRKDQMIQDKVAIQEKPPEPPAPTPTVHVD